MSAASVRFVNEMGFDDRVMAAAIVGLGVNGRLKMTDDNGSKELHHLKKGKPADLAEQAAERALFAERSTVALSSSSHRTIGDARTALQQSLRHSFVPMLFRTHFFWAFAGLVAAAVATCAIIVAYAGSYGSSMRKRVNACGCAGPCSAASAQLLPPSAETRTREMRPLPE